MTTEPGGEGPALVARRFRRCFFGATRLDRLHEDA